MRLPMSWVPVDRPPEAGATDAVPRAAGDQHDREVAQAHVVSPVVRRWPRNLTSATVFRAAPLPGGCADFVASSSIHDPAVPEASPDVIHQPIPCGTP